MSTSTVTQNLPRKLSISWGTMLVIVFTAFVLLMATMVYKAVNTQYDLVSKDYYAQELRHQEKITATQNASELGKIEVTQSPNYIYLHLPHFMHGKITEGTAWLYCPTNAKQDAVIPLTTSDNVGVYSVNIKTAKPGRYILKTSWQFEKRPYYLEKVINIQ